MPVVSGVLTALFLSSILEAAMSDTEFAELVMEIDANKGRIESALKAGANPNAQLQGMPILYYAIFRAKSTKDASIVKLLVEYKADVNAKVDDSPLLATVLLYELDAAEDSEKIMTEIVNILVEAGADVNAVNENGQTPLAILAESDAPYSPQLMRILRNAGATIKGNTTSPPSSTTKPPIVQRPTGTEKEKVPATDLNVYKINYTLQEIRDPQMNNELAATVALPEGWKFNHQNIVQWNPATYSDPARISYTLSGPKDEATWIFMSKQSFHYDYGIERLISQVRRQNADLERQVKDLMNRYGTNTPMPQQQQLEYKENTIDGGGIVKKPVPPELFIFSQVAQDITISNVQVIKTVKPEPIVEELKKALPEINKQLSDMIRQSGVNVPFKGMTADTAMLEFTCFKDGKQYEQQVAVIITYMRMGSPCNVITGASDEVVYWTVSPLVSAYALKGKLKDHALEIATIMGNSQVNPVWTAKVDYLVAETIRQINERQLKHQQEIAKIMIDTSNDIARTRQETFQKRQDSMSKVMQGWTDVITSTDRVRGDDGKIYPVPTGMFPERKVPWAW